MPITIALLNHKGGVGKTTSAVNIAACLGEMGKKTLLVDLDPQGSATSSLGMEDDGTQLLKAMQTAWELPVSETELPELMLVPAGPELAQARERFSGILGAELLFRSLQRTAGNWEWVVIDCPPSIGILTRNALRACQAVVIPMEAHHLSLHGLSQLVQFVDSCKTQNPELRVEAILPCRVHPRRRIHQEVMTRLEELFPGRVAPQIRENVSLAQAPGMGRPVILAAPRSHGAQDYREATRWLVEHFG